MSKLLRVAMIVGCALFATACSKPESKSTTASSTLKTDAQKFGYSVGYDLGRSMRPVLDSIDVKALELGIEQGAAGKTALIDAKTRREIKVAMGKKLREQALASHKLAAEKNANASKKFLARMAKQPGVKTTADGLEYKVDEKGSGAPPTVNDTVTVNYRGTLPDGTEFDSSYARKQPLTFQVKSVIPGWVEGLQLMKPGAKYTFYIPPELAYGEEGAGDKIGPNQALVFQVQLLKVARSGKRVDAGPPSSASSGAAEQ